MVISTWKNVQQWLVIREMQIKLQWDTSSQAVKGLASKRQVTGVSQEVENCNPCTLLVGILKGAAALETTWQNLKKLNTELPYN